MSEERARILGLLSSGKITVDEAEKLLDALKDRPQNAPAQSGRPPQAQSAGAGRGTALKYLRVTVVSTGGDNVNVRVPLALVRAGIKLSSLIPPQAIDRINGHIREHGFGFDLNSLKSEDIETLIDSLGEMEVNVDSASGDKVRVFCE